MPKRQSQFKFRKNDRIGSVDAEDDRKYLQSCFVDTGDLDLLADPEEQRRIVVGRTGCGKSAILMRLREKKTRVIQIEPESLALTYISNSTILGFFIELGIDLNVFSNFFGGMYWSLS